MHHNPLSVQLHVTYVNWSSQSLASTMYVHVEPQTGVCHLVFLLSAALLPCHAFRFPVLYSFTCVMSAGEVCVEGVYSVTVTSMAQVAAVMAYGATQRATAAHKCVRGRASLPGNAPLCQGP